MKRWYRTDSRLLQGGSGVGKRWVHRLVCLHACYAGKSLLTTRFPLKGSLIGDIDISRSLNRGYRYRCRYRYRFTGE